MAGSWFEPARPTVARALEEPTEKLPVIAPRVGARTVIVYERRSWGLLIVTGLLVALTAGVILGQTVAFQPRPGTALAATGEITPPAGPGSASAAVETAPSGALPPAAGTPTPVTAAGTSPSAARISAPLGRTTEETFEVSGDATLVSIVAADLGDRLYTIGGLDDSAVPAVTATRSGPVLTFVRTAAPGRVGATVELNRTVRWTLRFTGRTAEQSIDLRAGRTVAVDLAGVTSRAVLRLPHPAGTVPLRLTGDIGTLDVLTTGAVPVRLRLGQGADTAVVGARTRTAVQPATTITPAGWSKAAGRYDLSITKRITSVRVARG